MKVSALLCEYAQVQSGKLHVVGGGLDLLPTRSAVPPHPVDVYVAGVLSVPVEMHGLAHLTRMVVVDESGDMVPIIEDFDTPPDRAKQDGTEEDSAEEDRGRQNGVDPAAASGVVLGQFSAVAAKTGAGSLVPFAMPLAFRASGLVDHALVIEVNDQEIARLAFRVRYRPQVVAHPSPAAQPSR